MSQEWRKPGKKNYEAFSLRLSPGLKRLVEEDAQANDRSINKTVVYILKKWFESRELVVAEAEEEEAYEANAK